ncbi:unnamed protein product [Amaranthus hypochondriacus]
MANLASPQNTISPDSDKRYWSTLHKRVESILETRKTDPSCSISSTNYGGLNSRGKKLKEDSMLLIRGFDSVASSLSTLTANLENALQGAREIAKPSLLTEITLNNGNGSNNNDKVAVEDQQPDGEKKGMKRKLDAQDCWTTSEKREKTASDDQKQNKHQAEMNHLKKIKNLAVALATKSASLARELKSVKSDMGFLQERCALLEEENLRLRDGFGKGDRPDDDDLVRLQLEALLAEKARLATENANLTRDNQCLRQLVEYHQFASEDLSASYEQAVQGLCLDFSSPLPQYEEDETPNPRKKNIFEFPTCLEKSFDAQDEDDFQESETTSPRKDIFEFPTCLDKSFDEEKVLLKD